MPGSGTLSTWVRLFRVDAPWNSRQGLLVIARDDTGPLVRTAVAAGAAQVGGDPARLPRLRRPLVALALLLLALAVGAELWSRRTRRPRRERPWLCYVSRQQARPASQAN